ncbi:MAG TPA: C39 family peptidase [Gammaproteobacteria bacterium]|nr:C39 family peptidase [Gammaproteobacteria bacterium]
MYRYYGEEVSLHDVIAELPMLEAGGTLDVFLANHALARGYRVTLYTYNLKLFDPTWFSLERTQIREKLREQAKLKHDPKLRLASRGYDEFLANGGRLELKDLEPSLLRRYLKHGIPLITGLSATYLYRSIRDVPETNQDDDVRGEPVGHFVVLTGYKRGTREVLVADPYKSNPLSSTRYYAVKIHRLIGAILLGIMTYDANLLVIEPQTARR